MTYFCKDYILLVSRSITVNWFQFYLSNRLFLVNFSQPASVSCGVPRSSILESPFFSIKCHELSIVILLIHVLFVNIKIFKKMENQLNEDFCNICDWFVNNKLSIHFGGHKTKSILFASKFKRTNSRKLYIKYGNIQIKQHSAVKYLGCL